MQRGGQKLSYTAVVFLLLSWLTLIISVFVAVDGELKWLDYLYVASYVKLVTSIAKYIPQVSKKSEVVLASCKTTPPSPLVPGLVQLSSQEHYGVEHRICAAGHHRRLVQHSADVSTCL